MKFYSIFHLNLMFSSIRENQRKEVIEKCYWPLLKLARSGFKAGIELTGLTLEIIQSLDEDWIIEFKDLIKLKKVELVGSGYSQLIGPLVPSKVNQLNQKIGIETYIKILGVRPKTALINEMAYSSGILEHYISNGYESIVMELNNSIKYNPNWKDNLPNKIKNQSGESMNIIWANSIAFQKFQRHVHGDISLDEYVDYLKKAITSYPFSFPLYTSDAEVFDFRPGRFKNEGEINNEVSEWNIIEKLYNKLVLEFGDNFVLPSQSTDLYKNITNMGVLESPQQPIVVKKQNKYNLNRWALTGRNDLFLNTTCYLFYDAINNSEDIRKWKQLCFFWSSDFRTHITICRWNSLLEKVNDFASDLEISLNNNNNNNNKIKDNHIDSQRFINLSTNKIDLTLDTYKGCSIKELTFKKVNSKPLLGTINHGYFDNIDYAFDYYSGNTLIDKFGSRKITDLSKGLVELSKDENLINLTSLFNDDNSTIRTNYSTKESKLIIHKKIQTSNRNIEVIHPFYFTFIPENWDKDSLYFSTHNGGSKLEKFLINKTINHGIRYSYLISSIFGLGNTEGEFYVGDKYKCIKFSISNSMSYLIPTIKFEEVDNSYLLRLTYSAQEIDDTFKQSDVEQLIESEITISILS
jgi:hypothetical protein